MRPERVCEQQVISIFMQFHLQGAMPAYDFSI